MIFIVRVKQLFQNHFTSRNDFEKDVIKTFSKMESAGSRKVIITIVPAGTVPPVITVVPAGTPTRISVNPPTIVRIQRKSGAVVQDCDTYIGRACFRGGWELKQSIWYNPFTIKNLKEERSRTVLTTEIDINDVLQAYKKYLFGRPDLLARLPELAGKRLGCWCKPAPCHGDILVELFNRYI